VALMTGSGLADGWSMRSFLGVYRFRRAWDVQPAERSRLVSEAEAVSAVRAAVEECPSSVALGQMREALSFFNHSWLGHHSRQTPLEEVLEGVRRGRLVAVQEEVHRPAEVYRPQPEEPWEKPPPEPVKVTASMDLKFVYDQADEGVGALEFKVRTPDGKEQTLKTDGKGVLKLRNLEPGYVELWTELKDARLETTVTMRAQGEAPTPEGLPDFETKDPAKHLLQVTGLRVHDKETLKTIAEDCDLDWKKLALFNFGSDDEKKLLELVPAVTGCHAAKSLDALVFDDSSAPGIIFWPKPWRASFHTSQTPVIRLAGLRRPVVRVRFSL
jgi:hypothetical protein